MTDPLVVFIESPAALAGMPYPPLDMDWHALRDRGFGLVVRLEPGDYDASPLRMRDIQLQDLHGGLSPTDPIGEKERVWDAARVAAEALAGGEGVVVHCRGGIGRTGTVVACALRLVGRSADDAIAVVKTQRPGWPESPWQLDVVRSG